MADERGITFVEYLIVLCVVALLGFGAWRGFGSMVSAEVTEARNDISIVHSSSGGSAASGTSGASGSQGSGGVSGGQSAALSGTSGTDSTGGGATQGGSTTPSGVSVGLPDRPTAPTTGGATGALSAGGGTAEASGSVGVVSNNTGTSSGPQGRNRARGGSGTHDRITYSEAGDWIVETGAGLAAGAVEGVKSALSGSDGQYDSTSEIVGSVLGPVGADFAAPVAGVAMDIQDIRVANNAFWEDPGLGTGGWLLFVGTIGTVPGVGALAKGGVRAARAAGDATRGADAAADATSRVARGADQPTGAAYRMDPSWRPSARLSDGRYDDQMFTMSGHGIRTDAEYPVRIFDSTELEAHRVVAGPNGSLVYAQSGDFVHSVPNADGEIDLMYVMDRHGNLYATDTELLRVHHSSLAGGDYPAGAGMLDAQDGSVRVLDEDSGHYGSNQPFGRSGVVLQEMERQGVDTSAAVATHSMHMDFN